MENKITKLNLNSNKESFGDALGIDYKRFKEISRIVYDRTKEGVINHIPKSDVVKGMIDDLNGVTQEELLLLGMSFGALEYLNKKGNEAGITETTLDKIPRDSKDIASAALNKKVFVEIMKNEKHDF